MNKLSECNKKLENINNCYGCIYRDNHEQIKAKRVGLNMCEDCTNSSNKKLIELSIQKEVKNIFDTNETETVAKIQRRLKLGYHTASWLFDNCL